MLKSQSACLMAVEQQIRDTITVELMRMKVDELLVSKPEVTPEILENMQRLKLTTKMYEEFWARVTPE